MAENLWTSLREVPVQQRGHTMCGPQTLRLSWLLPGNSKMSAEMMIKHLENFITIRRSHVPFVGNLIIKSLDSVSITFITFKLYCNFTKMSVSDRLKIRNETVCLFTTSSWEAGLDQAGGHLEDTEIAQQVQVKNCTHWEKNTKPMIWGRNNQVKPIVRYFLKKGMDASCWRTEWDT